MRTRARAADSVVVDVPYLATTFGVPETELQTLLDAPTTELIQDFLQSLHVKGQEFDAVTAEKLKLDVELENTVRTSETKVKAQKAAVTRQANEIEQLRTKLNEAEAARESLASELEQLRSSSSDSTLETQALRQRIETLEASNRDALALVESKSSEKDRVATELSEQHSKLLVLRREVGQLEERNQALENAASSQKFKEQSLQQEIDLMKRNNEWHANELQTRGQEHAKFRKERNARIATLQRELEDTNANLDALKRTEGTLRKRLDELQTKADDAHRRIATLQDEAARKEQDFRTELDTTKRLADLQAQNASTHRTRLQEVQAQVDQIKDEAADEIGHLQAEIETERSDKEQAERRVAELELSVERLEQQPRFSRPATPSRNGGMNPSTPGRPASRAGSPPAPPGSMRKTIGNLSITKLTSDLNEAQQELEAERRRTHKLSIAVDELINELESRKPELEDMHSEQARLEGEILDYTRLLDESNETRDKAVKDADNWHGEADAATRESLILRQQLRDLSAQIKILLVEMQSRDQGLSELSADERLELERAARGELDDATLDGMTSTGRLISERLVIFHGVSDLQAQNEQLLRLTRELGEKMEGEEARAQARQSAADAQEVADLRQQVGRYKDELQATATQIDSYMKERDMFRRMLQHRGQLAPDVDVQAMFGQSVPPATPNRAGFAPPATPRSKDVEDLNKLLKEQQAFFDQYRNESSTDRRMLKEQLDGVSREKSQLQADVIRAQSQLTLASERYDMLQSNYSLLRNENGELQKRSQQMAENAAKQDLRTQQVAEELVEARSAADLLRNENANARAEKELRTRIETRLTEDNQSLVDERSRLNKHVADLQNLQNERELADSETRRRLQNRVENVESELAETKKKLDIELDENRKAALRRDYEENQSRTRIDDLVKSLGNVREESVVAKTTRDQLQSRVDELKIDLRAAEEKVAALQPRPTPRAPSQQDQEHVNGESDDLPAEQRLALEASELRRDLELSKSDLESARQQIEQFRAIAQSTEEELANFSQTADQYKEDAEQSLEEKETRIKELEQRIEDLNAELTTTNGELSELRSKAEDGSRLLADQQAAFDAEAARLRDDAERYTEERKLYQADLKAQAEIAQQAQQSYENELLKHADAAKSLQSVRKDYNDLRTEVAGIRAEADAAKVSLERGEESWTEQRERFEHELEELKRRRQDVDDQNKVLHQQMEAFSTELAALRQGRAGTASTENEQDDNAVPSSGGDRNFQEVIRFLRREKEIVDVQYELSIQEAKRLQQQLEYSNSQLEEARQKLVEERRQSADRASTEGSTNKLMQTINELNLFRESSVTLRNEARQAREKLEEKSLAMEQLLTEMEPLKGRVIELEGELESREGNLKLLQDDRDHWRERTQNIISKYDRVDPAELEEMKTQLEELKTEKARLETERIPLQEQVDNLSARIEEEKVAATQVLNDRLERIKAQAKEQDRKRVEKIRDLTAEKDALTAQLDTVRSELSNANTDLEQTRAELEVARTNAVNAQREEDEEGQIREDESTNTQVEDNATIQARIAQAEANAGEYSVRAEALAAEVQTLQARINELETQVVDLQQRPEDIPNSHSMTQISSNDNVEALEKLKAELATAQQEVETLRQNAVSSAPSEQPIQNTVAIEGEQTVAEQVAAQVAILRAELENQHELATRQMEETYAQRMETLRNGLRRQLKEVERPRLRAEIEQEVSSQHSEELQKLKEEHDAAIARLKEEHAAELQRLSQDGATAVAKAETSAIKTEASSSNGLENLPDLTEAQVREMIKTNATVKSLVTTQIRTHVDKQTEKFKATIAEKDAEIARLTSALENAPIGESTDDQTSRKDLENQLDAAKKDKEAAVRQAVENAEKKAKVQLSQRDILQAKIAIVRKAATETPEKTIKEIWDVADKARPAPKAVQPPLPSITATASPTTAKPAVPASPVQATPPSSTQTPEQIEAEKLRARQLRFGTDTAVNTSATSQPAIFGQPSAQAAASSFGQPSQAGTLRQVSGTQPNPQAPAFMPGSDAASSTAATGIAASRVPLPSGIPQPGSGAGAPGSRLPRAPGTQQSNIGGPPNSAATSQSGNGGRGGAQSGLPRGGRARGGRGGRGGGDGANAGQKRQHDGDGGGDGKRQRGGGPNSGS